MKRSKVRYTYLQACTGLFSHQYFLYASPPAQESKRSSDHRNSKEMGCGGARTAFLAATGLPRFSALEALDLAIFGALLALFFLPPVRTIFLL